MKTYTTDQINADDIEDKDDAQEDLHDEPGAKPFVEPTPAEKAARLAQITAAADKRQDVHQAVADGENPHDETIPMSERATLGLPESFTIGKAGSLVINLRGPVIIIAAHIRQQIYEAFPAILLLAASSDRFGKGVDIDAIASYSLITAQERNEDIAQRNAAAKQEAERTGGVWEPELLGEIAGISEIRHAVMAQLDAFTGSLSSFNFANPVANDQPGNPHPLNVICDIVWTLAQFDNPTITRVSLPELLASRLRGADFADLVRAIFRCLSGSDVTYESDPFSRFTSG